MKPQRLGPLFPTWPFTAAGAGALTFLIVYGAGGPDWPLVCSSLIGLAYAFRLLMRGL